MSTRPKASKPKPKPRQDFMKRADKLFSKFIRERDGGCVAVGEAGVTCAGYLQCAHLISRSYKAIRVDPDNAVALCSAHHTFWTHRPLEWESWVEARFPGRWMMLRERALSYDRVDWRAELARLKEFSYDRPLIEEWVDE